jgi:hypothetical protein
MPRWNEPAPPNEQYLAVRAMLGMASHVSEERVALLRVRCPWCDSGMWQPCVNTAMQTPKREPHEARYIAADLAVPRRRSDAGTARRQVEEARAERIAWPGDPGPPSPVQP